MIKNSRVRFFCLLVVLSAFAVPSYAKGNFGLGVVLFGPTGISANYYLSKKESIDAALAFDIGNSFNMHATYLKHYPRGLHLEDLTLDWYWGIGARLHTKAKDNETRAGARASLGLNHFLSKKVPIQLFGELSLILDVIEKTDVSFGVGLGARYYF